MVQSLAAEAGAQAAQALGGDRHEAFFTGAGDVERPAGPWRSSRRRRMIKILVFKVTRCRYAEKYRELGLQELGEVLSCGRDAAFARGFNPKIGMKRTTHPHVRRSLLRFSV